MRASDGKIEQAIELLSKFAAETGADAWDIIGGKSESDSLSLSKGRVDSQELTSSQAVSIRIFRNGSPGYAYSERMSGEALQQMVRDAWEHTFFSAPIPVEIPAQSTPPEIALPLYDPAVEELSLPEMERFALELDSHVRSLDHRIGEVTHLGLNRSLSSTHFFNSKQNHFSRQRSSVAAGLQVLAIEGDSTKTGSRILTRRGLEALDSELLAREAVERALSMLHASPVESGDWPVILDRRISGALFSLYSSAFYAQQVQKGQSFLADKMESQISSPLLNLIDDPHRPDLSGSRLVDGEGIVTAPLKVIEKGVLKSWLYNLESSGRAQHSATGNGSRGFTGGVGTQWSNMIVSPGTTTLEEMEQKYPRLLLINQLEGASGCSAVSGELSIGAQGHLIEEGKRVRPVDGITLSGNWLQLLSKIDAIGFETADSFSSVQVPDLLLSSIRVSG